jgi:20S proteasome alpha/beta subunit
MTLCVAAACQERGKPRIVIGTDWRAGTETAAADIQDKLYWIDDNIAVLIAGTVSRAVEFKDTYKQFLLRRERQEKDKPEPEREPITAANLLDVFKAPSTIYKNKLVNEYIGLRFGMTYSAFLRCVAKKEIPDGVAEETLNNVKRIYPDCQLIILLFLDKRSHILKVDDDGSLESCESFAAIGSGADVAESVLYQREHEDDDSVGKTVYHVFEAMLLGSIAPGVGDEPTIDVLYPQGERSKGVYGAYLNKRGEALMKREFKKRGPKTFSNFPQIPDNCFDTDFE